MTTRKAARAASYSKALRGRLRDQRPTPRPGTRSGTTLTGDEWAVIRVLRIADESDLRSVFSGLVAMIEERGEGLKLADQETIVLDLAKLITIATGKRGYERGTSAKTAVQVARAIAGLMNR